MAGPALTGPTIKQWVVNSSHIWIDNRLVSKQSISVETLGASKITLLVGKEVMSNWNNVAATTIVNGDTNLYFANQAAFLAYLSGLLYSLYIPVA